MPTIKLLQRKKQEVTQNRKDYQYIYQDTRWKTLRAWMMREHPICQDCELEGKVHITEAVHHVRPFDQGKNQEEVELFAFSPNNLRSLCNEHHSRAHQVLRGWKVK